MAKDYAKRVYTTRRTPKKKRWRIEFVIIPAVIILCLAGYGIYKFKSDLSWKGSTLLVKVKELITHQSDSSAKKAKMAKTTTPAHQEPDIHFDFYNELPNMQVTIPEVKEDVPQKVVAKVHDPEAPRTDFETRYILELGLFKDNNTASQLRLSLLLSGCEAEVVVINSPEGKAYRVQRGPFINQTEAKKLQRVLQKKGIESLLKKA